MNADDILDSVVEAWHTGDSALPLHEYMGLTWEQYAAWTEGREVEADPGRYGRNVREAAEQATYEQVVPKRLRDLAESLDLEPPAWYVGQPDPLEQREPMFCDCPCHEPNFALGDCIHCRVIGGAA